MKRYDCTVSDKRGEFGLCMEKSTQGKFVLYSEYFKLKQEYDALKKNYELSKNREKFKNYLDSGIGVTDAFNKANRK